MDTLHHPRLVFAREKELSLRVMKFPPCAELSVPSFPVSGRLDHRNKAHALHGRATPETRMDRPRTH